MSEQFLEVDVSEMEAFEDFLAKQAPVEAEALLKRISMRAANVLRKAAEAAVPVRTGQLEESITRKVTYGPATVKSWGEGNKDVAEGEVLIEVGPGKSGFYDAFLEFGAPEHNIPAGHQLQHAAESSVGEAVSVAQDEAAKMIQRLGSK